MYLNYFKLQKAPFNITPDPDLLFPGSTHKEALAAIIYGIRMRKGFISITGEVGLGKTTILRSCLERMDKDKLKIIYVFNPDISFARLVKMICGNLSEAPTSNDLFDLLNRLYTLLIEEYKAGRNVALIIDEAQNMPVETLESLRMLSNLETTTDKLIQIVLSGQPEFEEKLNSYSLRQLKQRISLTVRIKPFTRQESIDYIAHRVARASAHSPRLFSDGALKRIVAKACGVPRVINIICDNCLVTAYGRQCRQVTAAVAREVLADFEAEDSAWWNCWRRAFAAACSIALFAGCYLACSKTFLTTPATASSGQYDSAFSGNTGHAGGLPTADEAASRHSAAAYQGYSSRVTTPVTWVVKRGDTLAGLVKRAYGYADSRLVKHVLQRNPEIADVNVIREGEKIIFPYPERNPATGNEVK